MFGQFLGFKILNFNILGLLRKNNILGGYEELVFFFGFFFGVLAKLEYFGVIFFSFRAYSEDQGTIWEYFGGLLKFQILLGYA